LSKVVNFEQKILLPLVSVDTLCGRSSVARIDPHASRIRFAEPNVAGQQQQNPRQQQGDQKPGQQEQQKKSPQ
jgi:hypothetical protein